MRNDTILGTSPHQQGSELRERAVAPSQPEVQSAPPSFWAGVAPYIAIARPDHWLKNVFVFLGVLLAAFYRPEVIRLSSLPILLYALAVACIVASSNYVINEWLDAPSDRHHPEKKNRPAASGAVRGDLAILEWLVLGAVGVGAAFAISVPFALSALALWVMGCVYNIRPLRTKEIAYLDVLSESINNPIRLMLGWFAFVPNSLPPISLVLSYWMIGAFFMTIKRYAEYRRIGNKFRAALYRRSFRIYDEPRLLTATLYYACACALFTGVFIVRYKLELVLWAPLVAGFMASYFRLGLKDDTRVDAPETLYKETGLVIQGLVTAGVFATLMFVEIPMLYDIFRVESAGSVVLWRLGG